MMNPGNMFGLGFGTGAAFFGFLWAKSNQIRNATLLDLARTGGLEKLADGRFYRIVHESDWNRLSTRLRTALAEVETMWKREQETLARLTGGMLFTAAPTARPSREAAENDQAALDQLDGRAAAAEDVTGGFAQPNCKPVGFRAYDGRGRPLALLDEDGQPSRRGGLIDG